MTDNWREEARKWLRGVKTIALSKRIYEDETPIYANEAPHKGRSRVGKPIIRPRSRYATKVHTARLRKERSRAALGLVRPTQMSVADTLIWDRLGRSGRALHPTHQHYSPAVREEIQGTWRVNEVLTSQGQVL